jgi:hypothetical protein
MSNGKNQQASTSQSELAGSGAVSKDGPDYQFPCGHGHDWQHPQRELKKSAANSCPNCGESSKLRGSPPEQQEGWMRD